MILNVFLKIFSECCILLALPAAFPKVFPHDISLLIPALICGLAAGLSALFSEKQKPVLGRLCAVLPLAALLLVGEEGSVITFIPAILYTAASLLLGRLNLDYHDYRKFFRWSLIAIVILYLAITIIASVESTFANSDMVVYGVDYFQPDIILHFTLLYLLCGVILQRRLRLGNEARAVGSRRQVFAMLGIVAVTSFVGTAVGPRAAAGATKLLSLLFTVSLSPVIAGTQLLGTMIDSIEVQRYEEELLTEMMGQPHRRYSDALGKAVQEILEQQEVQPSIWWVVPLAIVMIGLMVLMILSFRKRGRAIASVESHGTAEAPSFEKKNSRRPNRAKLRHIYREFLRQERKRGLLLKKNYTTEDILQQIAYDTDRAAAAELRELYLAARYDMSHDITAAQVEAAKAALKRSRGDS